MKDSEAIINTQILMKAIEENGVTKWEFRSAQNEIKQEFASVRTEMKEEFAKVRAEMKEAFTQFKTTFIASMISIDARFKLLEQKIDAQLNRYIVA
jgi:hypothetical protein